MKKLIAIIFLATVSLTNKATAQQAPTPAATTQQADGPKFKFKDGDTFDFGEVVKGPDAIHEFVFTNTGNQPLTIIDAKPSCSCTTPEWPKEAIAPGTTGVIKVGYHTTKEGPFLKEVFIQSNAILAEGERRYTIYIKGVVK